ncbi:hypothetical protein [Clostridium coskatii]|uniref:DUF5659 domain-containing protein n=1 Tax=Clostridium coskatii TaxID=1705578 RepID=A0A162L8J6_9CLOT|nr:hypothetical protein [Clostridium coskatii]OAA90146.1 hypothetical protein WX73_02110 [Clostridium coskatii]OBR91076.1 hypothetical protein CLCOS_36540 [Clostridium coskatii]
MKDKYYTFNRYLAMALSWCGYHFEKNIVNGGKPMYIFQRTEEFEKCLYELVETKKIYGNEF